MTAHPETAFACDACGDASDVSYATELVLCPSCFREGLLVDAADAVALHGESVDVEWQAWAESMRGLPDAGAL